MATTQPETLCIGEPLSLALDSKSVVQGRDEEDDEEKDAPCQFTGPFLEPKCQTPAKSPMEKGSRDGTPPASPAQGVLLPLLAIGAPGFATCNLKALWKPVHSFEVLRVSCMIPCVTSIGLCTGLNAHQCCMLSCGRESL